MFYFTSATYVCSKCGQDNYWQCQLDVSGVTEYRHTVSKIYIQCDYCGKWEALIRLPVDSPSGFSNTEKGKDNTP